MSDRRPYPSCPVCEAGGIAANDCPNCGPRVCEWYRSELAWITDQVRYWSYCMSQGMRAECPEKVGELADFLIDLKIAPYYVRNTHLETVLTTDSGTKLR